MVRFVESLLETAQSPAVPQAFGLSLTSFCSQKLSWVLSVPSLLEAKPSASGVCRDSSNTAELVLHVSVIVLAVHSLLPACTSAPVTQDASAY